MKSNKRNGGDALFVKTDVFNSSEVEALVKKPVDTYGRLDIACNNAGIGGEMNPTADYSIVGWQKIIAINLSSVFYGMKYRVAGPSQHQWQSRGACSSPHQRLRKRSSCFYPCGNPSRRSNNSPARIMKRRDTILNTKIFLLDFEPYVSHYEMLTEL